MRSQVFLREGDPSSPVDQQQINTTKYSHCGNIRQESDRIWAIFQENTFLGSQQKDYMATWHYHIALRGLKTGEIFPEDSLAVWTKSLKTVNTLCSSEGELPSKPRVFFTKNKQLWLFSMTAKVSFIHYCFLTVKTKTNLKLWLEE